FKKMMNTKMLILAILVSMVFLVTACSALGGETDPTVDPTVLPTEDVEPTGEVISVVVDLGSADNYVVLAESAISTTSGSDVTGDLAVSPAAATYITGFDLIMDSTGTFSTSSLVTGKLFASDYTSPTPTALTTAIADMRTAYTDAAGRAANYTELYSGNLSGQTLTAGVYKFGNSVLINTDLTLEGSSTDVWIFQIAGNLTMASDMNIILAGGALAKNIVWQVADTVAIGSGSHFEGTILAMTNISMGTNSSINGSLYAQTDVSLDATTVVKP
ncbi:MAG: ice-binding family protein, partial [Acholeplasmataceae bacterium]|nr:ice-binding family protein [Acholeplasmataceae bacterium]